MRAQVKAKVKAKVKADNMSGKVYRHFTKPYVAAKPTFSPL
jgi:hypothetical protein